MNSTAETLILYGVPFSQPVRAVMWLLLIKKLPFRMVPINPGSSGASGSRNPEFLKKNPSGTIPCIEEPDSGFTLGEGHAILTYLANKHEWTDLYPQDPRLRAVVDYYLHYHHRNVRDASLGLVAPKIRKDLNISEEIQQQAVRTLTRALQMLDDSMLNANRFIACEQFTIADIAAYVEIGQLQKCFTNVFDLAPYTNVQRWLNDMSDIEFHDDVHLVLSEIGDISVEAPSMENIVSANKLALARLGDLLSVQVG